MRIIVRVKPNSKQERVEKIKEGELILRIKAPAKEGKANEAVIKVLARHFKVPPSAVSITGGFKSKNKRVEIR